MPRLGRKSSTLLLTALLILAAALSVLAPAGAQGGNATDEGNATGDANETGQGAGSNETDEGAAGDGAAGDGTTGGDAPTDGVPRYVTVRAQEAGCSDERTFCWDIETLPVLPGDTVHLYVDLVDAGAQHNMHIGPPIDQATEPAVAVVQEMTFQIPENFGDDDSIEYICDLHPTEMVGTFVTPAALTTAGGDHEAIPDMGVHFLAYWVGVIAFALLFIVYGATFFLFKYNETPAATDHFDRGKGDSAKLETRNAVILAILFAAVATAALIFVLA